MHVIHMSRLYIYIYICVFNMHVPIQMCNLYTYGWTNLSFQSFKVLSIPADVVNNVYLEMR